MPWKRKWQSTPVFLSGESQGRESLVGCRLWGRTESDTAEAQEKMLLDQFTDGYGDTAEKAMAPHSCTLAWKIPWTEEPGGLQAMGSR